MTTPTDNQVIRVGDFDDERGSFVAWTEDGAWYVRRRDGVDERVYQFPNKTVGLWERSDRPVSIVRSTYLAVREVLE